MVRNNAIMALSFMTLLVFSFGFVAATTSSTFSITDVVAQSSVLENAGSFDFTFNLTYTSSSEHANFTFDDSTSSIGTVSISDANNFNGLVDESRILTGTVTGFSVNGGQSLTVLIDAMSHTGEQDNETTFSVSVIDVTTPSDDFTIPICTTVGDLEISDFTLDNLGIGDDEEWEPLDEIEIEVEVENNNNDDSVQDVFVEIFILDSSGDDVTSDFDIEDEEIDLGRIRDDDTETAVFRIKELPGDIEDGNFKMLFHVYSDDDEAGQCTSESNDYNGGNDFYNEFEVVREEDNAVILKDTAEDKIVAQCGDSGVEVRFPIYNIGVDKEDHTLVTIFNRDLNVDDRIVIDNLKEGKSKEVTFFIDIPTGLTKTRYDLDIITYYEYDDDEEDEETSYDSNSDDDLDRGDFSIVVEVVGCNDANPRVNANLASSAEVGEELVINALVTNDGSDADFDFSVSGLEGWAELVSISPRSSSLGEGNTREVIITLMPTSTGAHTFDLNMIANGEIFDQSIAVDIAGEEMSNGNSSWDLGNGKIVYYLAAAIAILLILIFVILLVRVSRKSETKEEF